MEISSNHWARWNFKSFCNVEMVCALWNWP